MGYDRIDQLQEYRDYKTKRKSVLIWLWKNVLTIYYNVCAY